MGLVTSRGFYVRNLRTDVISWKGVGKSCSIEIRLLLIALSSQLTDHLPNNLDLKQYIVKTVYAYTYSLCTDVPPPSDFFLREGRRLYTGYYAYCRLNIY